MIRRWVSREKWYGWLLLFLGVGIYSRRPIERLWANTWGWRLPAKLRALALVPVIRFVGDVAKMIGYPVGLWRRRQGQADLTSEYARQEVGDELQPLNSP